MARLTDKQRDMIISDFNIGVSQNQLALKYECSPATINKLCKGLEPKYKDKVNTVVSIKTELSKESEYQSECFDKEVNDKLRREGLVFNATEKLLKKASQMIDKNSVVDKINVGDGVQNFEPRELNTSDFKNLIDTIDKASITLGINPRHANTNIKVDNNNLQQTNLSIEDISLAIANGLPD